MPTPGLSELITTTLRNRTGELADNVTNNNALLKYISASGNVKPFDGGRTIVQEIDFQANGTYKRYSGYDVLNIAPTDVLSAAEFDIKQAGVAITMSGLEELQNSGKERVIDWLEARIINAERTLENGIAQDCYSAGTSDGGKQIGGLQLLVADAPSSGTVGGIDRGTYTFWRNLVFDATSDGGAATTASNIQTYMDRMYAALTRGKDKPNLIVMDNYYWSLFEQSMQAIQRIVVDSRSSAKEGQLGFSSYRYKDADVVLDGGFQGPTATPFGSTVAGGTGYQHMYFLNTKYLHFRPHKNRNFVPIGEDRMAVNQDAIVKLIGFAGNMTTSCAFLQGVIKE